MPKVFYFLVALTQAVLCLSKLFHSVAIHDEFDNNSYWITSSPLAPNELPSIAFGSLNGNIHLYNNGSVSLLANLPGAVHGVFYDVNQDGHNDLIVAHKFGTGCPQKCLADDGYLSWLENPKHLKEEWKRHDIGKSFDAAHRVTVVNKALDRKFHRLLSIPIAGANTNGMEEFTRFQISYYKFPDDGDHFLKEESLTSDFTVCHEGKPLPTHDGFTLSCSQGEIVYRATDTEDKWEISHPIGNLSFTGENHTGLSSSTLLGSDTIAFIAPLHGGHIGITKGTRTVFIDEFERGGHDIQSAQFLTNPSSQTNQLIVAIRETALSGVYFYTIDDDFNVTHKIRVYDGTPSMLTVGDFDGDGKLDFASINWGRMNSSTVIIHYNRS